MKLRTLIAALAAACAAPAALAGVYPQCPFTGGTEEVVDPATGLKMRWIEVNYPDDPAGAPKHRQVCAHVVGGDGWMVLGDGRQTYGFGFSPAQGEGDDVMRNGLSAANFVAPTLTFKQGDEVWLALTNVGMNHRPDLFDSHSVHWHGFPNASAIFDGVPQASATVQMGSTITYYYKVNDPGTYMWHCHVEATEHMEMGMLGMLNVLPSQNNATNSKALYPSGKFAYNDGDGSTGYDREFSLQMGGIDANFHELHELVQPLPFLELRADFTQLNGRGYPMTTLEGRATMPRPPSAPGSLWQGEANLPALTQPTTAAIKVVQGERLLLRLSNLSVDSYYTLTVLGLPMQIVGRGAQIARGQGGESWSHGTSSVTLGGGDGVDLLIDTKGAAKGTYHVYTTNLNFLSNGANEDRGGLMTTLVVQ